MAQKGSRARSQSAGRGWNDHLMDAVAVQIANTFQFGSGAKGRRGEAYHGHGKGPQGHGFPPRLEDNPDDWPCSCGLKVWARKTECPQCHGQRPMKGLEVKVQTTTHGSQPPQTQQAVGTEEDAAKVEEAKKRGQLKHIAKTIAGWPEDQKDGDFFKSMQREAEALKASLVSSQPTDMQLLGAKEEVNATKRRVLKSEKKRDQAVKDLTTAKDEVAASRASNTAAVLEALEAATSSLAVVRSLKAWSLFFSLFRTLLLVALTSSLAPSSCMSVGCDETRLAFKASASFCMDLKKSPSFWSSGHPAMVFAMCFNCPRFFASSSCAASSSVPTACWVWGGWLPWLVVCSLTSKAFFGRFPLQFGQNSFLAQTLKPHGHGQSSGLSSRRGGKPGLCGPFPFPWYASPRRPLAPLPNWKLFAI